MNKDVKTMGDIADIARRRKWSILLPSAAIFVIAVIVAFAIPPSYRSTSTILIEEQEIPREFVTTTVTSYAEQRLQVINQRIMSTPRLMEIINRFNLYADLRQKKTTEEILDRMRKKDIRLETISANVVDHRTGRAGVATIAFTLSYEGQNPTTVQQVANVLASLYLEENLRVREQQAEGATKFMEEERKLIQAELSALDGKIAEFKQKYVNTLPELSQFNLQGLERMERDIDQLNDQLRTLREKESYLQTQLASMPADSTNPDRDRLRELKVRLSNLKTRYTDEFPDVIKVKAEIADIEIRLRESGKEGLPTKPDNPAYVTLASQLASTQSEIDAVKRQIQGFYRKRDDYRRRIEATPKVEEGYKALVAERNNLQIKHDDLTKKFMEAKVAAGLEKGQMGERFTLIDSARLPEKPVSPNIPAIVLIGLVLGIGCGVGMAALKEFGDQSLRSAEALARVAAVPVLAVIPKIVTPSEIVRAKVKTRSVAAGVTISLMVLVVVFHFFIMDLDILWAKVMRRMQF